MNYEEDENKTAKEAFRRGDLPIRELNVEPGEQPKITVYRPKHKWPKGVFEAARKNREERRRKSRGE